MNARKKTASGAPALLCLSRCPSGNTDSGTIATMDLPLCELRCDLLADSVQLRESPLFQKSLDSKSSSPFTCFRRGEIPAAIPPGYEQTEFGWRCADGFIGCRLCLSVGLSSSQPVYAASCPFVNLCLSIYSNRRICIVRISTIPISVIGFSASLSMCRS